MSLDVTLYTTGGKMRFEVVEWNAIDMAALDAMPDRLVCQRRHWLEFAASISNGKPVIGALVDGSVYLGYISGILFHRLGLPIFGSPFIGWTTPYIGFNLHNDVPRREALRLLEPFVFRELGCVYLEIWDRHVTLDDAKYSGFEAVPFDNYISDLTSSEDELFSRMKSMTRRCIRKAEKLNVLVEEADPKGFSEEYYGQLREVFHRQGLTPTYSQARVQALIDHVFPSGDLLLLRARDPEGHSIATSIYGGFGNFSFFWGNASWRRFQIFRPNQALHWYALRYWKRRGIKEHEWGGPGHNKEAYGPRPIQTWRLRKARYSLLSWGRNAAETGYYRYRAWKRQQGGASKTENNKSV